MNRLLMRVTLPLGVAAMLLSAAATVPAHARPDGGTASIADLAPATNQVTAALTPLAQQLAGALAGMPDVLSRAARTPVDLATVAPGTPLARAAADANQQVLRAKGLPSSGGSVLRLRLADPAMGAALVRGQAPVVVAAPSDDDVATVIGYDTAGRAVAFDPTRAPERPVLLVEVDVAVAMSMGLAVLRQQLTAHGLSPASGAGPATGSVQSGYWATKVTAIRLSDVKEPWFKGAAEIFSIVGGFDLNGDATVDIVDMPYLDDEDKTYFPNQLVVHFNNYKYDLADIVMMEDDGDTNYQALAGALITALLSVVDLGMYTPLVGPILDAMPGHWWTDDPDYVESWYTLATTSSGRLYGASGNGWMDVTPHWVPEL